MLLAIALTLALGPYHGPALNGSLPQTAKFGVAISGEPNADVALSVPMLPRGWIASFCTNRVCAPFRVSLTLPPSGRQTIELQIIKNDERAVAPRTITVRANGAPDTSIAYRLATH